MNNVNLIKPIATHYLHIRSKDATQLVDGYNTEFSVQLQSAITAKPTEEIQVSLTSLEMPYSFYNVSSELENNTLIFKKGADPDTNIQIPSGNYDIDDLITTLNDTASFSSVFTASFSYITGKVTLSNISGESVLIKWSESNVNKELGYKEVEPDETVSIGGTSTSPFIVNLATVHSLYIKASFATSNVQSTRQGSSSTIQKISVDVNSTGIIYLNSQDHIQLTRISNHIVDLIALRITDQNDRLIQLNNCNYEMSLMFQIFPKSNTLPADLESRRVIQRRELQLPIRQPRDIVRAQPTAEIDDSHPIEGESEVSHKTKRLILDDLLDRIST
jgi:hypothetical protein